MIDAVVKSGDDLDEGFRIVFFRRAHVSFRITDSKREGGPPGRGVRGHVGAFNCGDLLQDFWLGLLAGCGCPRKRIRFLKYLMRSCKRKEALLARYNACLQIYAAAVEDIERIWASANVRAYKEFLGQVDEKRLDCERARIMMRKHIEKHGC